MTRGLEAALAIAGRRTKKENAADRLKGHDQTALDYTGRIYMDYDEIEPLERQTGEGAESTDELTQADGDLRLVPDVAPETYTCWDCGSTFTPTTPNQRECVRCYVAGKL